MHQTSCLDRGLLESAGSCRTHLNSATLAMLHLAVAPRALQVTMGKHMFGSARY